MVASRFMLWATRSLRIALRQRLNLSRAMASDTMLGSPGPVELAMREKASQKASSVDRVNC